MKSPYSITLFFLLFLLISESSQATLIGLSFQRISNNDPENIENQLSVEVRDDVSAQLDFNQNIGANQVLFTFSNSIGITSNISEIYFDDGVIFKQTDIINSIGGYTDFDNGGNNGINPGNLPGGDTFYPSFSATAGFGADVTSGNPDRGINSSDDILGIVIELLPNLTFTDLQNALHNGDLRIGLHVRSIGPNGGSDSFINNPGPEVIAPVPLPAAFWLFGVGFASLISFGKNPRKQKALT